MRKATIEESCDNIFADLGLPDAETHFLKAQIVAEIYRRMFKGNFREHSIERLRSFLTAFSGNGK